jgi:hypothetical protein
MKNKKTFDVQVFKQYVNEQLTRTDNYATEGFKSGLCVVLEEILHSTGNYNGYNDLYWLEEGCKKWWDDGQTEVWDEKKVYIYGTSNSKYGGCKYARRYY